MNATSIRPAPVLLVLEGRHDIEFLRRIGRLLQAHDSSIPDLDEVESRQRLIVLPVGGDNLADQSFRFVRLPFRQLHLYDRESASHSTVRQQIVDRLNAQAHVRAFLTGKRSLENYLHSNAIAEVCGVRIPVNDESCLPSRVAQTLFEQRTRSRWESLPSTARRRLRESAKKWLNTTAVDRMTLPWLAQRDPDSEISQWFRVLGELLAQAGSTSLTCYDPTEPKI